jgi:hypothetical protein
MPVDQIVYGVDTYPDPEANKSLKALLKIPFNGYRKPEIPGE